MNKNTIIALVVGLIIGGLAIWLFMFFAQGTSMGTAIGLNKSGSTTNDKSKYYTVQDAQHITLNSGVSAKTIDQNTVEIITPDQFPTTAMCKCVTGGISCIDGCSARVSGLLVTCEGNCTGSQCQGQTCTLYGADNLPLVQQTGGSGQYK